MRQQDERGFTLLEVLMVVVLIAILAAVGVTAFVNYTTDTKNSATKANLQILRNAIAATFAKSQLDCGNADDYWPCADTISNNTLLWQSTLAADPDCPFASAGINSGQYCTSTQVPGMSNEQFVAGPGVIPVNPWGSGILGAGNKVVDCEASGSPSTTCWTPATATVAAIPPSKDCSNNVWGTAGEDGWCYDSHTGQIWANTRNNGASSPNVYEYSF